MPIIANFAIPDFPIIGTNITRVRILEAYSIIVLFKLTCDIIFVFVDAFGIGSWQQDEYHGGIFFGYGEAIFSSYPGSTREATGAKVSILLWSGHRTCAGAMEEAPF